VAVLVGPGLNGADGRVAAAWLRSRGAKVDVIETTSQPKDLRGFALVIDAAFGLGCSRPYQAPRVLGDAVVLAVDLPSGVDADSGAVLGSPMPADVTMALGALKRAHVTGVAAAFCGQLRFAGMGIVQHFDDGLVEDRDLGTLIQREPGDHKWTHAIQVFAGSTLMPGAADLVVRGALAAGASMIRLSSRGDVAELVDLPAEVVRSEDSKFEKRSRCVVAGPGVGTDGVDWLGERLIDVSVPVVLDADGLNRSLIRSETPDEQRWLLTPHEGEFARLTGEPLPADRLEAVRSFARATNCVVLLKGPTTIIADRDGRVRVVRSGTPTLATAGSGDVLSGVIGATIAGATIRSRPPRSVPTCTDAPARRCRSTPVPRIFRRPSATSSPRSERRGLSPNTLPLGPFIATAGDGELECTVSKEVVMEKSPETVLEHEEEGRAFSLR